MEFVINEDGVIDYGNWNTTEGAVKGEVIAGVLQQGTAILTKF